MPAFQHFRASRSVLVASGLLLLLVTVPIVLTWRAWRQEKLSQALIMAVKQEKVQQVLLLLEQGADADSQDVHEDTRSWFVRLREMLHKSVARSAGLTALQLALPDYDRTQGKHPQEDTRLLAALLRHGANPNVRDTDNETPLLRMLESDHRQAIRLLVEHGADVNAVEGRENDWTPLTWAAYNGDVSTLKLLLDHGALVDPPGRPYGTPLTTASEGKIVLLLLQRGANGHARRYDWRYEGTSPLIWAAFCGNEEGVELLLQRHTNVNDTDTEGRSVLLRACQSGNLKIVTKLVQRGARVNAWDKDGNTPLIFAARYDYPQIAKFLLAHGATVNKTNYEGNTAFFYARRAGGKQIIKLLRNVGLRLRAQPKRFAPQQKTCLSRLLRRESIRATASPNPLCFLILPQISTRLTA